VSYSDPFGLCIWDGCILELTAASAVAFAAVRVGYNAVTGRPLGQGVLSDAANGALAGATAGFGSAIAGLRGGAAAAGARTTETQVARTFTDRQLAAVERQLAEHGEEAVTRSLQTWQARLTEHLAKRAEIVARGGNANSLDREIRNFRGLIDAAKQVLGVE